MVLRCITDVRFLPKADEMLKPSEPLYLRPKPAIDRFLEIFGSSLEILHKEYQVAVRKLA